ncbi:hypothetical protein DY218_02080 [Streptomyces triticagri]|uniref:TadE-like domain-containing protein n=1 Tax=Streptomyces triticagri TaxID=2293568 RepID=A0A372MD81_9ACTN|nr:TadE family type IV pilus minor pilin [Streptomyces triticagri]RFU88343.1 hypothetical protein DY218_02080 [Streptomyces triticagri]
MPSSERSGVDEGCVTAETAVVLPVLAIVAVSMLWGLMAACAQIQCVDAARAGARAAARQEASADVVAVAEQAAPRGARVSVGREGELVRVSVEARSAGIGGLALDVGAEAVALAEDRVGGAVESEEGGVAERREDGAVAGG